MPSILPAHALLIRHMKSITHLSERDEIALVSLPLREKRIDADRDIVRQGQQPTDCRLVLKGIVCRYKIVAGGARQILSFHFAGDLPDLQNLYLETADFALSALTPATVALIPLAALRNLNTRHIGIAEALARDAYIDAAISREWTANVGRRVAIERVAHLFCECLVRMRAMGLATETAFELPITQAEIGDATGLSAVHVNRTLQALRRMGAIGAKHAIGDWNLLQQTGDFDPAYLHMRPAS